MRLPLALVGLLLLVPLLPPGAAQLPVNACGPLEATAVPPGPLAPGESGTLTLTIMNRGQAQVRATASLNIQETGWEFDAEAANAVTIAAESSQAVTFQVRATEATEADATAVLAASGTCLTPAGTDCALPQCQLQAPAVTTRVQFRAAEGLQIPGLQNLSFPPEYLIASLVLVGLVAAIFALARRPKRGISADCPEPLKLIRPGRGASFPIAIRNAGGETQTAQLEVSSVPEGWSAFMPLPDVQLAPRESRSLFLMVRAPEEAEEGDAVDVEVTVRPQSSSGKSAQLRVRAEVKESASEATLTPS